MTAEENGVGAHRLVAGRQRDRLHFLRPGRQSAQRPQGEVRRLRNRRRRLHDESSVAAQTARRAADRPQETAQAGGAHQGRCIQRRSLLLVARQQAHRLQRQPRSRPRLAAIPRLYTSSTWPICMSRSCSTPAGPNGDPKWSPDGKEIAYTTSNGQPFFYYANRHIAVIPAEGGQPRLLTKDVRRGPEPARLGTRRHLFHAPPRRPPRTFSASTRRPAPYAASAGRMTSTPPARPSRRITAPSPPPAPRPITSPRSSSRRSPISRRDTSPMSPRSTRISASPRAKWCSGNPRTARPSRAS